MPAVEPLNRLLGINISVLNKKENLLLEAELFVKICERLKEIFREQYKDYFRLMKFNLKERDSMLDIKFVELIIKDILSTQEYNLKGIAFYTNTSEDFIDEMLLERNINPSGLFLQKIIDLHRSVRSELYKLIIDKIIAEYIKSRT